jgi:hypothetical protein
VFGCSQHANGSKCISISYETTAVNPNNKMVVSNNNDRNDKNDYDDDDDITSSLERALSDVEIKPSAHPYETISM